jgi:hypothetical protein
MIPEAAVALGIAQWPAAHRIGLGFEPAIAPPIPLRFSARAAQQGLLDEARSLFASEEEAIRLCAAAAPPRFSAAKWEAVLKEVGYPELALNALLRALNQGASIDPAPSKLLGPVLLSSNHGSLYTHLPEVQAKLEKQWAIGTLAAWERRDVMPRVVAPLGTVTKFGLYADEERFDEWRRDNKGLLAKAAEKDMEAFRNGTRLVESDLSVPRPPEAKEKTSVRVIHDARHGINDRGEAPSFGALTTLREIAHYAQPGDYMWVDDIQGAFKLVSPVPWQTILLASIVLGALFIDTRLTFGLNMSPYLFHACVAHPLMWVVCFLCKKFDVLGRVFQYVDDHIGVARSPTAAGRLHNCFLTALEWLNIPRELSKHQPASQRVRALGLVLDTSHATGVLVECPEDKVFRIRDICCQALSRQAISVKKLESLCGMIGFISVTIRGALVFTAELRIAHHTAESQGRKLTSLTPEMRIDLEFWSKFAASWNGIEVVRATPTVPTGHAAADAMSDENVSALGVFVCGRGFRIAIDRPEWSRGRFPDSVADIAVLELIAYSSLRGRLPRSSRGGANGDRQRNCARSHREGLLQRSSRQCNPPLHLAPDNDRTTHQLSDMDSLSRQSTE